MSIFTSLFGFGGSPSSPLCGSSLYGFDGITLTNLGVTDRSWLTDISVSGGSTFTGDLSATKIIGSTIIGATIGVSGAIVGSTIGSTLSIIFSNAEKIDLMRSVEIVNNFATKRILTSGINLLTIPSDSNISSITVKLWGAGGNAGVSGGTGGGGGAVITTVTATAGDVYAILIGSSGSTFLAGAPGGTYTGITGATGGSASALFKIVGGTYQTLAIASGGGGGGSRSGGGSGGGGGVAGVDGGAVGSAGKAGSNGVKGGGGLKDVLGAGDGNTGENYTGNVSALNFSTLNSSSTDGGGGSGGFPTSGSNSAGGGGGGGYGGGGGGAGDNTQGAGGGGGGGNYVASGTTFTGSGQTPGNSSDSDFGGVSNYAQGGAASGGLGKPGYGVIIFNYVSSGQSNMYTKINNLVGTKDIVPQYSNSYNIGSTASPYNTIFANTLYLGSTLTFYEEYSHSTNITGAISATGKTIKITRNGRLVTALIPSTFATATTASTISLSSLLPTTFRPANNTVFTVRVRNNGTAASSLVIVQTNGDLVFYANIGGSNFAGTGSTGFDETALTWSI
jgi:hypothetical protein